jgi:hypothetical protein
VVVTHSDLKLEVKVIPASLSFCISLIYQDLAPSFKDLRQSVADSTEIILGDGKGMKEGWSANPTANSSAEESENMRCDYLQSDAQKVRCHR